MKSIITNRVVTKAVYNNVYRKHSYEYYSISGVYYVMGSIYTRQRDSECDLICAHA